MILHLCLDKASQRRRDERSRRGRQRNGLLQACAGVWAVHHGGDVASQAITPPLDERSARSVAAHRPSLSRRHGRTPGPRAALAAAA